MALENVNNIDDLDPLNPVVGDPVNEGDDHIRNLKTGLTKNVGGDDLTTQLKANDVDILNVDATGAQVTGQVSASAAAPVEVDELTRKDYVDTVVAALQLQIDNLIDGTTKFTGAQEAPDFTAV